MNYVIALASVVAAVDQLRRMRGTINYVHFAKRGVK